jgi:hypothetical protein
VFGFDRRTQRLIEDLGMSWRHLGPIRLIAAPDAVNLTVEPHELLQFLGGRLSRAFIRGKEDLESRLSTGTSEPDPDGLFRVEDFFCHENTWRMTVSRLAREAAAVLMDLRGLGQKNEGCICELEQLIAVVSVRRVLLLVDARTDVDFLERTLRDAWAGMPDTSPNASAGVHSLRMLRASRHQARTLRLLLGLLCEGFDQQTGSDSARA